MTWLRRSSCWSAAGRLVAELVGGHGQHQVDRLLGGGLALDHEGLARRLEGRRRGLDAAAAVGRRASRRTARATTTATTTPTARPPDQRPTSNVMIPMSSTLRTGCDSHRDAMLARRSGPCGHRSGRGWPGRRPDGGRTPKRAATSATASRSSAPAATAPASAVGAARRRWRRPARARRPPPARARHGARPRAARSTARPRRAAPDLLVQLGQLAGDHHLPGRARATSARSARVRARRCGAS